MLTRGSGFTAKISSGGLRPFQAGAPEPLRKTVGGSVDTGSDLVEQAQLGNFAEGQLRGLKHGLLQGQAGHYLGRIGIAN